ncbi:MAG: YkgJ family cysteine cluster protein [Promethearchaeota archaeon]
MKFQCLKCGTCCHEYENLSSIQPKRIPVFPDELESLEEFAANNKIPVKFLEDLVFPDLINKKILVITFRIILDGENSSCPFFNPEVGCMVNHIKPIACKAYPLAQKRLDIYNFQLEIDPYCKFVENHYDRLKEMDFNEFESVFESEFKSSRELMSKNQDIILTLKKLHHLGKIKIPGKVSSKNLNSWLVEWEREYLVDFKDFL